MGSSNYQQLQFNFSDLLPPNNNPVSEFDKYNYTSPYQDVRGLTEKELFLFYDKLNNDLTHYSSRDDICTPMECVKRMIDYIPSAFWENDKIKVLDPCCGNGNFGAYCRLKTKESNIYYNDLNIKRLSNCKALLCPKHINNEDFFNMTGDFYTKFDLIVANPPYSGGGNKNRSLSNDFIEKSIDLLNDKGYLCFITPNNWMTYNNNNTTLAKLLKEGSFLIIDNNVKQFFPSVGSSFTVIVWQKNIFTNKTTVYNNYLLNDVQTDITIPASLKFIPLYVSQTVLNILTRYVQPNENLFHYRCDLHNFTKKEYLSDIKDDKFLYETIHTPKKTRFALFKQDIYDKWIIIIPLSTYYIPYIKHNVNTTQSVGYIAFNTKPEAEKYIKIITQDIFKTIIHLTRYGNFNNIMVLKHLNFEKQIDLSDVEYKEISALRKKIKY